MPLYHALGTALVTEEELAVKQATGALETFLQDAETRPDAAELEFSTGNVTIRGISPGLEVARGERVAFQEVGLGKPLTVEIRHVYTGKYPVAGGLFTPQSKGLLVTSALKNLVTTGAATRALNYLQADSPAYGTIRDPRATEQGTPLVYYSPAVVDSALTLTLELGFRDFERRYFDWFSQVFTHAAGLPVFVTQAPILIVAGTLVSIAREVAARFFEKPPVFAATESLAFDRPGAEKLVAGFKLIADEPLKQEFLVEHEVDEGGILVNKQSRQRYGGDLPYMVISVDGREMKAYDQFTPLAATAALLESYFNISGGDEKPLDPLLEALTLYNDWNFRKQADGLQQEIGQLDPKNDKDKIALRQAAYEAAVANIRKAELKPTKGK